MFTIMSNSAIILILLSFACPNTLQQTLPPKAVNPERINLLKDALSWMTFRKNGQLASERDLAPFFGALKERYLNSKYYRTMIIAFSGGVLPKLTLKETDTCDPAYTLEYRDSHNNSVTDGELKKFILQSYDKRDDGSHQFCDYREGLVCNQQTKKCECPYGSKMEPISQGSSVRRCLVQENEVCTLIDLDHDPSSNYGALKKHLPEMVFNLEKPVSCKIGTQCRFQSTNPTAPLCYGVNNGSPWNKGRWDRNLGDECTLGLYADTGPCLTKESINRTYYVGAHPGYTCFNFGPRSQPKSPRVGICAHEMGSYAISGPLVSSETIPYWELGMINFVSPATTPLRNKDLLEYYRLYVSEIDGYLSALNALHTQSTHAGDVCNVDKSEKLLKLWKFYKSLEDTPPQGKDYVATQAELLDKLEEAKTLTVDPNKKFCRVRSEFFHDNEIKRALRCARKYVPGSPVDNDGTCEVVPENEDVTLEWAKKFSQYQIRILATSRAQKNEEKVYRKDIFEPELECDPKLAPPAGSQGAAPSIDSDVLEGGYCPPDRGCYEDYGDYTEIYDNNCQLKDAKPRVWRNCQDLDEYRRHGKCEYEQLGKMFIEELKTVSSYAGLNRGDECRTTTEDNLRRWIETGGVNVGGNRYKRLIALFKLKNRVRRNQLCDRTKLLGCSQNRACECLPGTQPREVNLESGTTIYSDYCYVASGDCDREMKLSFITNSSSQPEKDEIKRHYEAREGESGSVSSCQASNWCVFTLQGPGKEVVCTTKNTGSTGHDGSEPVTTTTVKTTTDRDESNLVCMGDKCGWQDAGEARKEIHVMFKIIILIIIISTNCVTFLF